MDLLTLIIAIAFVQVWGAENPLHKDGWFVRWSDWLREVVLHNKPNTTEPAWLWGLVVLIPTCAVWAVTHVVADISAWLLLPLSVVIMLYSLGRGEFTAIVSEYTKACYVEDWPSGMERAQKLGVNTEGVDDGDWSTLHEHVLTEASYRGFERSFVIIFWFLVASPVVALFYRLLFLYSSKQPEAQWPAKCLWLLEWPVVRILGLSFAFTGNFVGCFSRLKECLVCFSRSSQEVLTQSILGALSVDENLTQSCEVTRKELDLLAKLYKRTLWFWLACAALIIIMVR